MIALWCNDKRAVSCPQLSDSVHQNAEIVSPRDGARGTLESTLHFVHTCQYWYNTMERFKLYAANVLNST